MRKKRANSIKCDKPVLNNKTPISIQGLCSFFELVLNLLLFKGFVLVFGRDRDDRNHKHSVGKGNMADTPIPICGLLLGCEKKKNGITAENRTNLF